MKEKIIVNDEMRKDALLRLEIMATNYTGELAEACNNESKTRILEKYISALDIAISDIKAEMKRNAGCEQCKPSCYNCVSDCWHGEAETCGCYVAEDNYCFNCGKELHGKEKRG